MAGVGFAPLPWVKGVGGNGPWALACKHLAVGRRDDCGILGCGALRISGSNRERTRKQQGGVREGRRVIFTIVPNFFRCVGNQTLGHTLCVQHLRNDRRPLTVDHANAPAGEEAAPGRKRPKEKLALSCARLNVRRTADGYLRGICPTRR
jgi:hypothetical protein